MARTKDRPLPSGRLQPGAVLAFGLVLSALSIVVFGVGVNVLSAILALGGNLFYVVVYTGYLKRHTPQNIVIGGIAGAIPRSSVGRQSRMTSSCLGFYYS